MGVISNPGSVHVNAALTNFAIGYRNGKLIANDVCPVMKVAKESDVYYVWDRSNTYRLPVDLRADGAASNDVEFGLSTSPYSAQEYALKTKITDRQRDNADSVLRLEQSKTRMVQDLVMTRREKRVATLLTTLNNWDSAARTTLSGTGQWNNASFAGSIEEDIDTGKEAARSLIGMEPNTIIIPAAVAKVMKRDATIRELIKYTQNDLLVNGDLPPTLWNMRVLIPGAVEITSEEGAATTVTADIWGKHVTMLWLPEGREVTNEDPVACKTFRARDWMVKQWRNEELSSTFYEPSFVEDAVLTSNISGYLIRSAIA